jgi:hypothetical protein
MKASKFSDAQKAFILKQGAYGLLNRPGVAGGAHWFLSLADAKVKVEDWRHYYNEERPMGDRKSTADFTAQARWRSQPAIVTARWLSEMLKLRRRLSCKVGEHQSNIDSDIQFMGYNLSRGRRS